jgi:hypothetical protein
MYLRARRRWLALGPDTLLSIKFVLRSALGCSYLSGWAVWSRHLVGPPGHVAYCFISCKKFLRGEPAEIAVE